MQRLGLTLLITVALTTALEHRSNHTNGIREKRELLVRTKRRWVLSTIQIREEDPGPFPKKATQLFNDKDKDNTLKFRISGQGVDEEPLGLFQIDPISGIVKVLKPVDREKYSLLHVKFDVLNSMGQPEDLTLAFDVEVVDINDNAPVFEPVILNNINENSLEGVLPISLTARDIDEIDTDNSRVTMRILSQEPALPTFGLEIVEGTKMSQLTLKGCFNYDTVKLYKVVVEARDYGQPSLSSTTTVTLNIKDSNTHPPVLTNRTYTGQVMEMESNKEVLRLGVTDKDTPFTPAWRARYHIVKGNEDWNYKIETDPKTNEGVLTIIKGKNYETKHMSELFIAVENEEPLFVCGMTSMGSSESGFAAAQTAKVNVQIIDVNDPPIFAQPIMKVYQKEEEEPGKVLYTPKVTDEDSDMNQLKFELVSDPANWMSIDKKTGAITTVKKMDRESPHVKNNVYTVVTRAIDNGVPPATATGTLLVNLVDVNDNSPVLVAKRLAMCGNQVNNVTLVGADIDEPPYTGPFSFSIGGTDEDKKRWKVNPTTGWNVSLVSLVSLAYDNYSVPLLMEDQQGHASQVMVEVVLCECGGAGECRGRLARSTHISASGVGLLLAGLFLLILVLCLLLLCDCREKKFQKTNFLDEGNQTLIKYNEEGGGSACRDLPMLPFSPTVTDGVKQSFIPPSSTYRGNETQWTNGNIRNMGQNGASEKFQQASNDIGTMASQGRGIESDRGLQRTQGRGMTWGTSRTAVTKNGTARFSQSLNLRPKQNMADQIDQRMQTMDELDYPEFRPHEYTYEGQGSRCESLEQLSLNNSKEDLDFLRDLGSKFKPLDGICRKVIQEKKLNV